MMRISFLAMFLTFALAACGGGDQQAAEEPAATPAEEQAVAEAVEAAAEEPAAADEPLQMVEESAGDADDAEEEEQPIVLAQAEVSEPPQEWQFHEGTHFVRMVPTQPTVGGADKIEVAEVFWYGCNHCNDFEPFINRWAEDIPPNARLVRIPATWNPLVKLHAQLYYTEEVLGKNGKIADPDQFRAAVFAEYHRRGNRLASVDAIRALFEKHGVSAADFDSTWNSFEVAQKLRVADDLGRRYSITGVPTMVVNGKYRTGGGEAGSYPKLLEIIDELIARESIR